MSAPIMLDLFAGAGGVTEGAEQAGIEVVWAANHWPLAVSVHKRWHPHVQHLCQDLQQANWSIAPDCDIIWASPSCVGTSEAGQPGRSKNPTVKAIHDSYRSTAWAVVDACHVKRPRAFVVENVPEFIEWDYLEEWCSCLRKQGYHLTFQVLTASCWGVPQDRRRLIIVGCLDHPITIDEPFMLEGARPPIGPCLDFEDGLWRSIRSMPAHKPKAKARAQHAHRMFKGGPCWGQHVSHRGAWAKSVAVPANTITTQNQHYLVADGAYRLWTVPETLGAMGLRRDYLDGVDRTVALIMAGNAVPPGLAAGILRQVAAAIA